MSEQLARAAVMLAVYLVLAGCTSTTAVLQDWVGAPEFELLQSWGKPNRVTRTADGGRVLKYAKERFGCRIRIEVSWESTIVGFLHEGNDCTPIKRRRPGPARRDR